MLAGRADTKRGHHVVAVTPNSPAGKSKYVFPGDILEIDGMDVRGYDAAELRSYIFGVPGSQVVLGYVCLHVRARHVVRVHTHSHRRLF